MNWPPSIAEKYQSSTSQTFDFHVQIDSCNDYQPDFSDIVDLEYWREEQLREIQVVEDTCLIARTIMRDSLLL